MNKQEIKKMIEDASESKKVKDDLMDLICEVIDTLEEKSPSDMKRIEEKMLKSKNIMLSGIDKEYAEWIVNEIYDRNNIKDKLFTYQKAEQLAKQHKIQMDTFTVEDWYIILVMAESDFKELLGTNMDNYVTYAKLWLMDKDSPYGGSMKLYDYLCYVAKIIDSKENNEYEDGNVYTRTTEMYGYPRNYGMRDNMYDRDVYEDTQSHMSSRGGQYQGQMTMNRYGYGRRR
jgi:acid stress-induced BolA-like protein IbaG/YrbA